MTTLADYSRLLVAYHEWADDRLLTAAERLSDEQFAEVREPFAHMLGTMLYWNGKWRHEARSEDELATARKTAGHSVSSMRTAYSAAHDAIRDFCATLTDESWQHTEQWWAENGSTARLAVGDVIGQVVNHGTQHRSEIAVVISAYGYSPGNLDYLTFRAATSRA